MHHLRRSLDLATQLIELADHGAQDCADDGCLVVFAIMRDCGYKIRESARRELGLHLAEEQSPSGGSPVR